MRLRKRSEFDAVHRGGRKVVGRWFVFLFLDRDAGPTRLGLTVGRRVGGAVRRNRVKRLVREVFRRRREEFPPGDLVVIARKNAVEATYWDVWSEFDRLLGRLRRSVHTARGGPVGGSGSSSSSSRPGTG